MKCHPKCTKMAKIKNDDKNMFDKDVACGTSTWECNILSHFEQ